MLDILKTIAGGIMAVLATVFGTHQAAVATSPPQPTSVQFTAAPNAANSTAISPTSSTTTTQQFQDLSSQQYQTDAQHQPTQHPASQQKQADQPNAQQQQQTAQQSTISIPPSQQHQTVTQSRLPILDYATKAGLASSTPIRCA